jgi:hypothetical protein
VRELVYVIDTAPGQVTALAGQAIDAVVAVKDLLDTAHAHGTAPDAEAIAAQQQLLHSALVLARTATKARATKLERKYHALTSLDAQRGITPASGKRRRAYEPAINRSHDQPPVLLDAQTPAQRLRASFGHPQATDPDMINRALITTHLSGR